MLQCTIRLFETTLNISCHWLTVIFLLWSLVCKYL